MAFQENYYGGDVLDKSVEYTILADEYFKNKQIPVTTVIGGGYSIDPYELASRHSIIFETALEMI